MQKSPIIILLSREVYKDLVQDNSELTMRVNLRTTPCMASISRKAIFKLSPNTFTFISHQNVMLLLFGETKAQEKIKYIKGSSLNYLFNELLGTPNTERPLRHRPEATVLHF